MEVEAVLEGETPLGELSGLRERPARLGAKVSASSAALRSRGSSRRSAIARPRPVLASASAMSAAVACAPRQKG